MVPKIPGVPRQKNFRQLDPINVKKEGRVVFLAKWAGPGMLQDSCLLFEFHRTVQLGPFLALFVV
jgi:hypothetical protein